MKKRLKGSLTVEAAIILPLFFLVIYSLIMVIKVVYVHDMVQHALTETAEDLSSYGYLYDKSGILEIQRTLDSYLYDSSDIISDASSIMSDVNELSENLSNIVNEQPFQSTSYSNPENLLEHIIKIKDDVTKLGEGVSTTYNNIVGFIDNLTLGSIFNSLLGEGYTYVKTAIGGTISKKVFSSYLSNEQLISLNVKDGIKGLDFSQSKFFYEEGDTSDLILLVVEYKIDIPTFMDALSDITLVNSVKTRAFTGSGQFKYEWSSYDEFENVDMETTIVYLIGSSGKKFHTSDCWRLNQGKQEVNRLDVIDTHKPCSICKPETNTKVVITSGGEKYHDPSCYYVNPKITEITLEEAKEKGYTKCNCNKFKK